MINIAKDPKVIFFGSFLLTFVLIFVGYILGFRIGGKFLIGRVGTVQIKTIYPGTTVFVDESKKITTKSEGEIVSVTLSPKAHSIIISKDSYLPWMEKVDVMSGKKITLDPVFASANTSGMLITKNDPDYYKIKNEILKSVPPNKNSPAVSKDGSVKLWLENNAIMISKNETLSVVLQPDTTVRNLAFYKDRSDVVMFSNKDSVYIIEADASEIQNFLPLYKGKKPYFTIADQNSIFVLDEENLMQVSI